MKQAKRADPAIEGLAHGYLECAAGRIHYVTAGAGDPLVLIHGGHGSWNHWAANIGPLAQRHRVIAPDLPGFAGSFNPAPAYSVAQYGTVVGTLLDHLGLGRAAVAGFSFGGLVAATAASQEPQRISHVALINSPGIGPSSPRATELMRSLSELSVRRGLRTGAIESLRRMQLYDAGRIDDRLVDMMLSNLRRTRFVSREVSRDGSIEVCVANMPQPLLVMIGREDIHRQHGLAQALRALGQRPAPTEVVLVEQARHWLQFERAAFCNDLLTEFIRA